MATVKQKPQAATSLITFKELLQDESFQIKNRKDIRTFYDSLKEAIRQNHLNLEGHSLPTTMNSWISLIEGDTKLLSRDIDVVDFSFANDQKFQTWKQTYLANISSQKTKNKSITVSQNAYDLLSALHNLQTASSNSLSLINGTKDDIIAGLSDLQGACHLLLDTYDKTREALKLPDRQVALERVRIRASKAKTSKAT